MYRLVTALLLLAASPAAGGALEEPWLGVYRDPDGLTIFMRQVGPRAGDDPARSADWVIRGAVDASVGPHVLKMDKLTGRLGDGDPLVERHPVDLRRQGGRTAAPAAAAAPAHAQRRRRPPRRRLSVDWVRRRRPSSARARGGRRLRRPLVRAPRRAAPTCSSTTRGSLPRRRSGARRSRPRARARALHGGAPGRPLRASGWRRRPTPTAPHSASGCSPRWCRRRRRATSRLAGRRRRGGLLRPGAAEEEAAAPDPEEAERYGVSRLTPKVVTKGCSETRE